MTKKKKDALLECDLGRNIDKEALQANRDIKSGKAGRIWRTEPELAQLVRAHAKERRIKVKLDDL